MNILADAQVQPGSKAPRLNPAYIEGMLQATGLSTKKSLGEIESKLVKSKASVQCIYWLYVHMSEFVAEEWQEGNAKYRRFLTEYAGIYNGLADKEVADPRLDELSGKMGKIFTARQAKVLVGWGKAEFATILTKCPETANSMYYAGGREYEEIVGRHL